MKKFISFTLVLLFVATVASANMYANFGAHLNLYSEKAPTYTADWAPMKLNVGLGREINQYISLEGRAGIGILDSTVKFPSGKVNASVKNSFGGYLRLSGEDGGRFEPYGLLGQSSHVLESSGSASSNREIELSGTSYGIGFNYTFKKNPKGKTYSYIEYIDHPDDESGLVSNSLDSINFGVLVNFN